MKLKWNLAELFPSIDACKDSFVEIDDRVMKLATRKDEKLTSRTLTSLLNECFECKDLAYKAQVYGSLCYYADIKNEEMIALKAAVEKKYAEVTSKLAFIDEMILACGEETIAAMMSEDENLSVYKLYLDDLFRREKHNVSSDEKRRLTDEINELLTEYNGLVAGVDLGSIEVDGKDVELTQQNVPKYLASEEREVRREAFEKLNGAYEQVADRAAEILNDIYRKRIRIAEIEHYQDVLSSVLDKENIAPAIIDRLISSVHKNLKYLQKYMALKAEYLHMDDAHLYDLGVPIDFGIKRKYPLEEGLSIIKEAFSILGDEYVSLVMDLMDKGHIDAIPDERRHQTIVFSWLGYSFLSYKDTYNDLKNLVHELGHSINDSLSLSLPFPYRISTLFTGETASITNEILLNRSLLNQAKTDEERLFYLTKEIDNFVTSMYRQTMYTELEAVLYYMVRKGEALTAQILNDNYMSLLKKYYGEKIVYDEASSLEWTRLGKLYRWAYYSYNYATGLLIANAVYAKLKDGSLPVAQYIKFLSSGANETSLDLLKSIDIDLLDGDIFDRGFDVLEEDLNELEDILKQKRFHLE